MNIGTYNKTLCQFMGVLNTYKRQLKGLKGNSDSTGQRTVSFSTRTRTQLPVKWSDDDAMVGDYKR